MKNKNKKRIITSSIIALIALSIIVSLVYIFLSHIFIFDIKSISLESEVFSLWNEEDQFTTKHSSRSLSNDEINQLRSLLFMIKKQSEEKPLVISNIYNLTINQNIKITINENGGSPYGHLENTDTGSIYNIHISQTLLDTVKKLSTK